MNINDFKLRFEKVIEHTQQDLSSVRTNRATPSLVQNIKVNVYGAPTPLIQVASINSPEPKQLLIEPWDKNVLKDIEKAIQTASLGLSVANEGNFLRVSMPAMTEETRQQVIKLLNEKLEQNKTGLRAVRDDVKDEIQQAEKNKEISEDEKFSLLEKLDQMTRDFTEQISVLGQKKEEEIKM